MEPIMRFGIIGCGMISAFHANAIRSIDDAELAGVFDPNAEFAAKLAEEEHARHYANLEDMLGDVGIGAVCICTPSGLHAPLAMQALKAGKHVLIEKPMALTLADCDEISRLAREKGLKAGVVSQARYEPSLAAVHKAIRQGRMGKLVSADLYMKFYRPQSYYDSGAWRGTAAMDGGGALMNQGIHGVDLMQYLVGPAKSVYAVGGTLVRDIEVEDTLNAAVEYACGAVGVIQAATSTYPGFPRRIELNGEYGYIVLEGERVIHWEIEGCPYYAEKEETVPGGHQDPSAIDPAGHIRQLQNFMGAVRDEEPLLSNDRDGRRTLEVILGAYESMRTRQPYNIPQAEGKDETGIAGRITRRF